MYSGYEGSYGASQEQTTRWTYGRLRSRLLRLVLKRCYARLIRFQTKPLIGPEHLVNFVRNIPSVTIFL